MYLKLALVALVPVAVSAAIYKLEKKGVAAGQKRGTKQLIYGLIFGLVAISGTQFGVPVNGAIINARDAAPLCAGLIFGSQAGIIAGVIGGLYRYLAVFWGAGTYTRIACSVSTALAGFIAAALRRWMFDDKKPSWPYGFAAGLVMEVIHMLMIFFTNMGDVHRAFTFVELCSAPMIIANSVSVMLALVAVSVIGKEKVKEQLRKKRIAQTFSKWLLAVVAAAFVITSIFIFVLQTNNAESDSEELLRLNLSDVVADISDASDNNILQLARGVASELDAAEDRSLEFLEELRYMNGMDLSEINIVDSQGIITHSTKPEYIGFDMKSGGQSAEFMCLNEGEFEYVQKYQPITLDAAVSMKYAGVRLRAGGFVQVGYNAVRARKDIDTIVRGATRNRHVGESGYMLITGNNWMIVSDPQDNEGLALAVTGLTIDVNKEKPNTRCRAFVYDEDCYYMYTENEGYYIIAVEPVSESWFARDLSVYVTLFMEILIFSALYVLVYILIKKIIVENIQKINHTLGEITGGNLDVTVDVRTNEEFISLSDDINSTVDTLKGYIAEAAARIDRELELAKVIQRSALPSITQDFGGRTDFELFATMRPAKEVGGDFYDFFLVDDDHLAIIMADVSGKGIPAAMFMMQSKALLKGVTQGGLSPKEVFEEVNNQLCENNEEQMFLTAWLGILDLTTGRMMCANAGHEYPAIKRRDGEFELLKDKHGIVLAAMEDMIYSEYELEFEPGDRLYVYTDGVAEATDLSETLYGTDRMLEALRRGDGLSCRELLKLIQADIDEFVGEAPQFDDTTMLCIQFNGK